MDWLADPQAWMAFATLTLLEIVLGIDNVVFIAIVGRQVAWETACSGTDDWLRFGHADADWVVIFAELGHAADGSAVCRVRA